MKKNNFFLNTWSLIFIYALLCVVTMVFSGTLFPIATEGGPAVSLGQQAVLLVIPAILLAYLVYSLARLFRDLAARKTGGRMQLRLAGYFAIVTVLATVPVLLLAVNSINRILVYWQTVDVTRALADAESLSMENYALKLDGFSLMVTQNAAPKPQTALLARQEFQAADTAVTDAGVKGAPERVWTGVDLAGNDALALPAPPAVREGFADRVLPRDTDVIRYIKLSGGEALSVYSFDLGEGFDAAVKRIQAERRRFEFIGGLETNIFQNLFMFFMIFLLPTLIMTIIISLTFSQEMTQPIVDIAQATKRVAAGDFSIHIITNNRDEMGLLVHSFNTMVENLEKSRQALVKAEKISVWQEMAQQLAHEIKNPLTPIKLSAERVLRRWKNEPERTGEIIESSMLAIIQEVESLSNLLSEFRTLSRPIEPTQNLYNLRDAVTETTAVFGQSYPNVDIDLSGLDGGIIVCVDKKHIGQIVMNLVSNAIDALDGNGRIEVRGDIITKRDAAFCRVSFKDNGKGIPKDMAEKIWTPYFTTKESGTGLGLAIVERIVQDYGGAVQLNTAPGVGTTFFIDLPVAEGTKAGGGINNMN